LSAAQKDSPCQCCCRHCQQQHWSRQILPLLPLLLLLLLLLQRCWSRCQQQPACQWHKLQVISASC
jgi:hypothetical protein